MKHHQEGVSRRARAFRRSSTDAESVLWELLRNRKFMGMKFRRQFPVGPYIVDFVCRAEYLVIEADGPSHALSRTQDRLRDEWIHSQGFTILRFSNDQILTNPSRVLTAIELRVTSSTRKTPPLRGAAQRRRGEGVGG